MRIQPAIWLFVCSAAVGAQDPWQVQIHGALSRIMHQGDTSEQVALTSLSGTSGLYGLGAAAGLKGEIILLDGKVHYAAVSGGKVVIDDGAGRGAAMLVTAVVPGWTEQNIGEEITSLAALERHIQAAAAQLGLAPGGPFPFLLRASPRSARWHVIDWPEGDRDHSHGKHQAAGLHGEIAGEATTFLGFYSDHHQGRFTHRDSRIHVHMITDDARVAGHVDALDLDGVTLLLPALEPMPR